MAGKRIKTKAVATCALLALSLILASCGGTERETWAGEEVRLDSETDRKVSTFTIGGDSFTLPCDVSDFLDKGYSLMTENGTPVDPDGIMVPGKTDMYTLFAYRDENGLTGIGVINMDTCSKPLRYCMVNSIEYYYGNSVTGGSLARDWNYMDLTSESLPEDVEEAFDGILELEINEWKNIEELDLGYDDKYRYISVEFYETDIGYEMKKIYVSIHPNDEIPKTYIRIY